MSKVTKVFKTTDGYEFKNIAEAEKWQQHLDQERELDWFLCHHINIHLLGEDTIELIRREVMGNMDKLRKIFR